jgi:diguanylate cyclase (GGDEF)-like protein
MRTQENLDRDALPAAAGGTNAAASSELRPRILVVDDVFDNRDILTRRLIRRGFEVEEASGGLEALQKIDGGEFDLVLLDIMMPDLSGNEVLRKIRETRSPIQLPVIMVTAKSHSEDVVESLDFGANDYVTKPVDFAVALARINSQILRKRQAEATQAASEMKAEQFHREAEERAAALETATTDLANEANHRKAAEERLEFLAFHDGLTGLLNRTAFRRRLAECLETGRQDGCEPALFFIDLDRFKAVNDVYGHEVGDHLLQEVGARIGSIVGGDAPVARLGGDEFGIFVSHCAGPEASLALAERIVAGLCEPFLFGERHLRIGASCGVACAPVCDWSFEVMVKAADVAMYRAKTGGRNRAVMYDPSMLLEIKERSALEVDLRRAIGEGSLDVFYQPLIDARTRRVTACEALVRWNHPVLGQLPPDRFITIAEEAGLIIDLGTLVLHRACSEARNWPEGIRVAVNMSPLQFRNNDLIATIERVLEATGLDPHRLELEITESALLEAREQNFEILHRIRALGIRLSMDDFGTGYSSISCLQTFDFDKVKIDRRFVQGLREGQSGHAVIKAIADLGTGIGVDLTAEGVETLEEFRAVTGYGYKEIQGFLFSHPLPAEDARAFIEKALGAEPSDD